jgi:hypothetical protein
MALVIIGAGVGKYLGEYPEAAAIFDITKQFVYDTINIIYGWCHTNHLRRVFRATFDAEEIIVYPSR